MSVKSKSVVNRVLMKLEANQYKCALTGWPITPSEFCIDHIQSVNDGGSDEPENLQCLHPLANTAKGTMSNQQFISLCKSVAAHASQ